MKYIRCLKPLFVFFIIFICSILLGSFTYILLTNDQTTNNSYIVISISSIIAGIISLIYLVKKYNLQYEDNKVIKKYKIIYYLILGFSLAIFINIIYFYIKKTLNIDIVINNNNLTIGLILTVIIGPIVEEYIFRGLVYNEFKKIISLRKSIIIVSILFSLMHPNVFQMIYAFILSLILCLVYDKTKNIKVLIFIHMIANLSVFGYDIVILLLPNVIIIIILIISLILLIISLKKIINHDD